jgi:hydrogenase nickel incorporation protein HypA/HybF
MHELSVCLALVAELEALARRHDARIRRVSITIGPLAGVEPDLVAQAYPLACAGTPAEASELHIERSSVRIRCRGCGRESIAAANRLSCGACGDWQTELLSGDELILSQVELDTTAKAGDEPAMAAISGAIHV